MVLATEVSAGLFCRSTQQDRSQQQPSSSSGLEIFRGDVQSLPRYGWDLHLVRSCYALALTFSAEIEGPSGAGPAAARNHLQPSVKDLEEIKTLDTHIKAWQDRAQLFFMQGEPLREEAAALGVGKLAGAKGPGVQALLPSALASLRIWLRWVPHHF